MLKFRISTAAGACLLALMQGASTESSGDYVAYKFQFFSDNNDVQVRTNTVTINKKLGNGASIAGSYLVDGITAASRTDIKGGPAGVDAVTSASRIDERRHQVSATFSFTDDIAKRCRTDIEDDNPTSFSITGSYGTEPDYSSKTGALTISQELFEKNTTISFAYAGSHDRFLPAARYVPPASDAGWSYLGEGRRRTDRVSASLAQIVSAGTIALLSGEYIFDRGYLSRPYYVYEMSSFDSMTNDTSFLFYHENLPPERKCLALSAQLNHYLPVKRGASLIGEYRYYRDSWEIESHTAAIRMYLRFAGHFIINPNYRFYVQKRAFFYRNAYNETPGYLTTDFRLGSFVSSTAGLKLIFELEDFIKPIKSSFFALFPVSFDIAANFMIRSSTKNIAVRDSHYGYFPIASGYRNFWIQSGVKCAF